jgi:uncharacterized protein
LRKLLPQGLELDTFGNMGWLSLVAMDLRNAHFRGLPPFPKLPGILRKLNLSDFPELNLRTYVRRNGRSGVYFFSLDTSSELIAKLAKHLFELPYFTGGMELKEERGVISFSSRRDGDPGTPGVYECKFRPVGGPLPLLPDTLDHFLAERDLMWTEDNDGDLFIGQIHHPPWTIYDAEAVIERNTMPETIGLTISEPPALLRYAEHTETVLWMIEPDPEPKLGGDAAMAAGA